MKHTFIKVKPLHCPSRAFTAALWIASALAACALPSCRALWSAA